MTARVSRLFALLLFTGLLFTPSAHPQEQLNNASVLKLKAAGLGDDTVVTTITNSPGHYDLSTDNLIALKNAGISDKVIGAMLQKNSGVSAAPPPGAPTGRPAVPPGVDDVGVYYLDPSGQYQNMATEIVNYKTGGVLKGLASGGLIKGDLNGNIASPSSRLKLNSPVKVILYVLEGQSPNEYQLLRMHQNSNNREFRSKTGGVVHQSTGAGKDLIDFDTVKIAPRIYQTTLPPSIGKGEYGFLPPQNINSQGSAASSGKIYTFSLVE